MLDTSLRPALYFWRDAYKAGIRITSNEHRFEFTLALSYWQRLSRFGAFGIFAEPEPAEPPQWVYAGLEDHEDSLRSLLQQEFPSQYKRFGGHLLLYEYELLHIEAHARRNGHHVQGVGLDGGYFLIYHGQCTPAKLETTPRPISPILGHIMAISI